ncbi:putative inhibitor of apoptosis [Paramacrobiotus metropolitanus]|uniref:putative inhibitor of apoptosis n=1 Tax=Paramacrobiotus metropolitanus TaxID=2943436 RepID=UPI002445BD22|nr:putative inhibitor of apoptosis [Paramacrobiotus metropolitanus]
MDMRNVLNRLATFRDSNWDCTFLPPTYLALSGLFYRGNGDEVQCAFCDGVMSGWSRVRSPRRNHQQLFPNCPMSKRLPQPISAEDFGEDVVEVYATTSVPIPGFHHYQVRFPTMMEYKARFSTFSEWPESKAQHPRVMAQAGFFYTGTSDLVQCFHCGRELERWVTEDGAWEEHARASPMCPFVIAQKGEHFVYEVQNRQAMESAKVCEKAALAYAARKTDNDPMEKVRCKVCLDKEVQVLFRPCNHLVCCHTCSDRLIQCPSDFKEKKEK